MAKSHSSRRWLKEHHGDEFVKLAQEEGYRSRAAFKLLELDRRDHLLRSGMTVVDLGSAPGGWSQVVSERIGTTGKVLAVDILPMETLSGVEFVQGDFRDESVLSALKSRLGSGPADLVISDMAPNISGINAVDQPRAMYLAELALGLAREVLGPGGGVLVKVFQGEGFDAFYREMRGSFGKVYTRKPKASRARSREVYVLGREYGV
ncbi:MAG: 23S rRNA (uridine(2552)-2'-O)-methyltransferase RlmE [Gammaproteobacteria bacterium]|nr:23S rRNA (uridine(2552)-2'-O)-methyltransferase RlmE [Gammaproteobacteria bacterium]